MSIMRKGNKWTVEEEQQLLSEFNQHKTIEEMCSFHHRTPNGILSRLHKLHLYPTESTPIPISIMENDVPLVQPISTETYICVIDTETTGKDVPIYHVSYSEKWTHIRMVQFAYELYTTDGTCIEKKCMIIKPDGFVIPEEVISIHGITNEMANEQGISIIDWCTLINELLPRVHTLVAHNIKYDSNVILSELYRYKQYSTISRWNNIKKECTMIMGKRIVGKWSKLAVLAEHCSIAIPSGLHHADIDTHLCATIYFYLCTILQKHSMLSTITPIVNQE